MNFSKPVLRFIDWLKPVWEKAGIDPVHLSAILKVKLTMDGRRKLTYSSRNRKRDPLVMQTIMNLIFGLFVGMIITMNNIDPQIRFLFYHSTLLLFFTAMIISEFSTILFDTTDNTEILPRPVSPKTYYASRIIHIIVYLLFLGVPLSLAGIIFTAISFGLITAIVLIVLLLFDILIAVFLSNVFYMGIIRFFSAKKIKDVVLYLQVFLAIAIYGGYQFLPRLFESAAFVQARISDEWWLYLIPTVWPAKISALLTTGNLSQLLLPIILNTIFPLAGLWAIIKFFAPLYNQKLSQLEVIEKEKKDKKKKERRWYIINSLPVSQKEKAFFKLIQKNVLKDRKFKQGAYSMLGYFVVLMLIPVFSELNHPAELIRNLSNSNKYFLILYFPLFMCFLIQAQIQYSDQHEATWLFRFLPVKFPGQIIFSGLMFVILRFMLPLVIITDIIVLLIWPVKIFPLIFLSWSLSLLGMAVIYLISDKYLPLSRSRNMQNSSRNLGAIFYVLILALIMTGISYACTYLPWWATVSVSVLLMILTFFLLQKIRRIAWRKVLI